MSDIFREVEDDLRREQAKAVWDRYGLYVIAVAVLVVAVTAGWRGWLWYSERQAALAGESYNQAMTMAGSGNHREAEAAFDAIAADRGPFADFARLRAAAERAAAGDTDGAVEAYDAIAGDSRANAATRDLARVRAGYLLIDTASLSELDSRLGAMAAEGNAWRHSAREVLGLAAWREGDIATASSRFEELIADRETPENMRNRAQLMIALVAADRPSAANAEAPPAQDDASVQEEAEEQ